MANNVFMVTMYSFMLLKGKPKGRYKQLFENPISIKPFHLIKYAEAKYSYVELKDDTCTFYYDYEHEGNKFHRCVELKSWLVKFTSRLNPVGNYYLVTTISIDKAFGTEGTEQKILREPYFCKTQDIVHLKQAFYGHEKGMYYLENGCKRSIRKWLDRTIENITGKSPEGQYSRHYIMDVCGIDLGLSKTDIDSQDKLTDAFSRAYYSKKPLPFEDVIDSYDRFVYGLIYGNENNDVIPPDMLRKTLTDSFSNNLSERLFAGHKTEVFLHTHHPYPWSKEKETKKKRIREDVLNDQIVFDMFMVMEAKYKLNDIERTLRPDHPSNIKDTLASISRYLHRNPYHLGEYNQRILMLYRRMGVSELLKSIKEQGILLSDAKEIEMNESLNRRVYGLTGVTVGIGIMQLMISILCCNNSNNSETMCDCFFSGSGSQGGCFAVLGCLLFIVLAASIIVMAVYQVKSFYKLQEMEKELKNRNK